MRRIAAKTSSATVNFCILEAINTLYTKSSFRIILLYVDLIWCYYFFYFWRSNTDRACSGGAQARYDIFKSRLTDHILVLDQNFSVS